LESGLPRGENNIDILLKCQEDCTIKEYQEHSGKNKLSGQKPYGEEAGGKNSLLFVHLPELILDLFCMLGATLSTSTNLRKS
jgi:hypothetical protein